METAEQASEWLQTNWMAIGAVVTAALVLIGRIRSGDWRGAFRLLVRLADAVKGPGKPPILTDEDVRRVFTGWAKQNRGQDNGKKPNS